MTELESRSARASVLLLFLWAVVLGILDIRLVEDLIWGWSRRGRDEEQGWEYGRGVEF